MKNSTDLHIEPITITLNGKRIEVPLDVDPTIKLLEFLRVHARTKSVKLGCGEGGCGACAVEVAKKDDVTGGVRVMSVNSCLAPLASVDGCSLMTAEGMGNSRAGFGVIQERIASFHGSQCGFCTPGVVVACHAALHRAEVEGRQVDEVDMERAVDGNLCRCTGYRPILDACKSFAHGVDIEDLGLRTRGRAEHEPGASPVVTHQHTCTAESTNGKMFQSKDRRWYSPVCLAELWRVLEAVRQDGDTFRVVGGNTGPSIYKNWITDERVVVSTSRVKELRRIDVKEGDLLMGGAVTLSEVISFIKAEAGGKLPNPQYWEPIASHMSRIAGSHVRHIATLGGHFALCVNQALESDVATVFVAAGATLCVVDGTSERWMAMDEFLEQQPSGVGDSTLVVAVKLPLPQQGGYFFSDRVAQRFYNSHSFVNLGVSCTTAGTLQDVRVAVACHRRTENGDAGWVCQRLPAVEHALCGASCSLSVVAGALEAMEAWIERAGSMDDYPAQVLPSMLLRALVPLLPQGDAVPSSLSRLLDVTALGEPPTVTSRQEFAVVPDNDDQSPVWQPIMKDKALLQASGEARYTGDLPLTQDAVFGAFVLSTEALATFEADPSAALDTPGVAYYITAQDVPGLNSVGSFSPTPEPEPVFANGEVRYGGQPLGLVVATSESAAELGAQRVRVTYARQLGYPLLTLDAAIQQDSKYELPAFFKTGYSIGDADKVIDESAHSVRKATWYLPSQQHFYMEPQVSVAVPDEGGSLAVWSSTQGTDYIQKAVSEALGIKHTNVTAVCRRLGGGFGGKGTRSSLFAVAASVAAWKLQRQVRIENNRNDDLRMVGGRPETKVEYDVGFDSSGRVNGLKMRVWLQGGAWRDLLIGDMMYMVGAMDQVYYIPNISLQVHCMRTNVPPRTTVRAPGHMQAALIIDHILERVAAECGVDSLAVREANFMRVVSPTVVPSGLMGNGGADHEAAGMADGYVDQQDVHQANSDSTTNKASTLGNGRSEGGDCKEEEEAYYLTSTQERLPAVDFTLSRIWKELKAWSNYEARAAEVEHFNRTHHWQKQGIAITACRFPCHQFGRRAAVHVYADGSVAVACGGAEMGQGLFTKVKQVAVSELSKAVSAHHRPISWDNIRLTDNNTELLPHTSMSGGSTTSEGCCEAVRQACAELVAGLKPLGGEDTSWEALCGKAGSAFGPAPLLSQVSGYWGKEPDNSSKKLEYNAFGAAVSQVLVDVLTGDRRVLRTDILYDCGKSINPAVDIGQCEGAFVQGLGYVLQEEVKVDPITGNHVNSSSWNYKIPSAACIPREFNVKFLEDSPCVRGILSSKAVGEPPVMLTSSVMVAMQKAVAAAMHQLAQEATHRDTHASPRQHASASPQQQPHRLSAVNMTLPLGPVQVKRVMGKVSLSTLLRKTMQSSA